MLAVSRPYDTRHITREELFANFSGPIRLTKITVETVRAKLDTTYMDTLVEAERSGRVQPSTHEQVKALEAEVDSLHSEILSVAQMSVEQQYLEQALQTVSTEGGQSAMRTSNALEYVSVYSFLQPHVHISHVISAD